MHPNLKILATGAGGMMGTDVMPILEKRFETIKTDLPELDITDRGTIERWMNDFRPDWVLHMAAITDLDFCETEPEKADLVNHRGTRNIAEACDRCGAKLIYISTSGIFSGLKDAPYSEDDIPKPKNVYGVSKYNGELAVQETLPANKWLILRAGWLFGGGTEDKKFVGKIYKLVHERDKISAVNDIIGSPNYTVDIGKLILYLIDNNLYGVYHVGNTGYATRLDIAREIVKLANVKCEVKGVSFTEFPTRALRPPMEAIENVRLKELGYEMRHWEEALAEYIERLKCELQF